MPGQPLMRTFAAYKQHCHAWHACHLSATDISISNAYIWIYQISYLTESISSGASKRMHTARTQINISQCNLTTKTILHLKYVRLYGI